MLLRRVTFRAMLGAQLAVSTVLWLALRHVHVGMAFSAEDMVRLRNDHLTNYSVGVLPLRNQSKSLPVSMSFFLIMIHNLNMKNQVLTASGWLKFEWCDEFLQWEPDSYGGIDELILFQKDVWLPDIFVENTAQHYRELGNNQMLISVKSSGMIHWEPGIITETSCAVNIGKYPFDTQNCAIRFLTWMHTNKTLTVGPEEDQINLDALLPNGEWDITSTEAKLYRYPSTYRPGTDHTGVTFVVHLRRKRFFYVLNTIIPVVMLSCLNVLVFILPSDCGERMALAVTVLLAFTVYLGIISDNIPKTSESLSLLAIYLTSLLALSTASVVCAGIVLNIHYRDPSHPVPRLIRILFSSSVTDTDTDTSMDRASSTDSFRNRPSLSYWEKRPASAWDQRRPSIWARRLTLRDRDSRTSRDLGSDDNRDDNDDTGSDTEKPFPANTSPTHHALSNDVKTAAADDSGPRQPDASTVSETGETCEQANHGSAQRSLRMSKTRENRNRENRNREKRNRMSSKKVCYDEIPFVERGVTFKNSSRRSRRDGPDTPQERGSDRNKFFPSGEGGGPRSQTTEDRNHVQLHSHPGVSPSEMHRLLSDHMMEKEKEETKDVTWHDIGNSLDRSLFWVFFLVTNTVTVVILVLFIQSDT